MCNSLAFRTPVLLLLLLDLDTPFGCVSSIIKMVADIIAAKLSVTFCELIRRGLFPE